MSFDGTVNYNELTQVLTPSLSDVISIIQNTGNIAANYKATFGDVLSLIQVSNVGGGAEVLSYSVPTLTARTILGSTNIQVIQNDNDITITQTGLEQTVNKGANSGYARS